MTPILIFAFGVRPVVAVGTGLAATAITKIFGGWQHYRQGTVDLSIVRYLAVGSIPGALLGVGMLALLERAYGDSVDDFIGKALGVTLVIMAAVILGRMLVARRRGPSAVASLSLTTGSKKTLAVVGALVGVAVGITSVGSGAIIVVVLALFFPLSTSRVVGTDVFHGALLVSTAALAHLTFGFIDSALLANLIIGSLPGVYIGSRLSVKMPDRVLKGTLAVVLLASGLKLV